MTLKLFIESYGCQMNVLDSQLIAGRMKSESGYELTEDASAADVVLFNTCSVREHAEDRALSNAGKLKKLKRDRPDVVIGIVGCMAQNRQDVLFRQLPHVQLVVGPRQLAAIPRLIEEIRNGGQRRIAVDATAEDYIDGAETPAIRTTPFQAYVKAMEGCDMSCTFCIVPTTRGAEVSRRPEAIVEECRRLVDAGTLEVTLLGQTIDSYGKGITPRIDLGGLLRRIHEEVPALRRIRFITSHPSFVRDSLIDAMAELPRVCKYVHMPAQSGSNAVLKAMRRGYTRERYLEIVDKLRERIPGVEIASDFIAGFPGETASDFDETVAFMERVKFQNSFVFQYSPRPGTDAAKLVDDVPGPEKARRNQVLLEVQGRHSLEKNRSRIGRRLEVLVEGISKKREERLTGRTDTQQLVHFEAGRELSGHFVTLEITGATPLSLSGVLLMRETYILRCFDLAQRGIGKVEPNPRVGAVLVKNGKIVGEGWHEKYGGPHAEVNAIRKAGAKAKGATLYCSLEPCAHQEKTPPCTDLILRSGIREVVAAIKDPHAIVNGKGLAALRKGGVKVVSGILGEEARRLNPGFFKVHTTGLPYVIAKWAMTLDGKIATRTGDSRWISNEASRRWLHTLRDRVQAIVVGSNTALRDDPGLRGKKTRPVRIVLDSMARVPLDAAVVRTARDHRTIIAVSTSAPDEKIRKYRRAGVEVIQVEVMDIRVIFEQLAKEGLHTLLVEGGGEVHASLFEARVVDEVVVFVAPKIIGGREAKTPVEGEGLARMAEAMALDEVTVERIDGDIIIRGRTKP